MPEEGCSIVSKSVSDSGSAIQAFAIDGLLIDSLSHN